MKLNRRLSTLFNMVDYSYPIVWDCCCDHGLLGFKFLKSGKSSHVNFVDIVPSIITELEFKLAKFSQYLPSEAHWQTYCCDVSSLDLQGGAATQVTHKHLVIISGVGGDLICEMVRSIKNRYPDLPLDFLLSPVHHTYKLRTFLSESGFSVCDEKIVTENNRHYEVLLVRSELQGKVSLTGDSQWENNPSHEHYLVNMIKHYQRIVEYSQGDVVLAEQALHDYKELYKQRYNGKEYINESS